MLNRIIPTTVLALMLTMSFPALAQDSEPIELAEYIEKLREQFIKLSETGKKDQLPLYISPIEIELSVVVAKEGTAGVKFYVVDAGGTFANSVTQKLRFTVSVGDMDVPYRAFEYPFMAPRMGMGLLRPQGG